MENCCHYLFFAFQFLGQVLVWHKLLRPRLLHFHLNQQQTFYAARRKAWASWIKDTWTLNRKKISHLVKRNQSNLLLVFIIQISWWLLGVRRTRYYKKQGVLSLLKILLRNKEVIISALLFIPTLVLLQSTPKLFSPKHSIFIKIWIGILLRACMDGVHMKLKLCLIVFLNLFLMLSILVNRAAGSRILFITLIPPLWAYVQLLFLQFLIVLMPVLDVRRCFRYAGCIGSTWNATGSILQGDLVIVVILNCVLRPC